MNLVTPRPGVALAALALTALVACQDTTDPFPTEVSLGKRSAPGSCDQGTIQNAINQLYPGGRRRAAAHQAFNRARQDDRAGREPQADLGFIGLAADLVDSWLRDELLQPRGQPQEEAVSDLSARLFACAGDYPPPNLDELPSPGDALPPDLAVGFGVPGQPFLVVTPSGNFSFSDADGDFLDGAAIFVVHRIFDDDEFSDGVYDEYPPRYRVTVEPYDAQESFDASPPPGLIPESVVTTVPLATVSVCPGDPHHHPLGDLRVLRRAEPFMGGGIALLPAATPVGLTCAQLDPYTAPPGPVSSRTAGDRLAALWRGAVHHGGELFRAVFVPAPLYAVDGGVGGGADRSGDFVAAMPASITAVSD